MCTVCRSLQHCHNAVLVLVRDGGRHPSCFCHVACGALRHRSAASPRPTAAHMFDMRRGLQGGLSPNHVSSCQVLGGTELLHSLQTPNVPGTAYRNAPVAVLPCCTLLQGHNLVRVGQVPGWRLERAEDGIMCLRQEWKARAQPYTLVQTFMETRSTSAQTRPFI